MYTKQQLQQAFEAGFKAGADPFSNQSFEKWFNEELTYKLENVLTEEEIVALKQEWNGLKNWGMEQAILRKKNSSNLPPQ